MKTPEEIIPSQQIIKVHGFANFGPDRAMRDVVNEAVLKIACGFSNGSTATAIIREHGLITPYTREPYMDHLTKKGREYLWSVYGRGLP